MSLKAALIKYLPKSLEEFFFDCSLPRSLGGGIALLHLTLVCFCVNKFGLSFELVSVAFAAMPFCLLFGKKGVALNFMALLVLLVPIFPSNSGLYRFWYIGLSSAFLLDYAIIALAIQEMQKAQCKQSKMIAMQQAQLQQLQTTEIELLKQIDLFVIKEETNRKQYSEIFCNLQFYEKLASSMQHEIEVLQHEGDSLRQYITDCKKSLATLQWEQQHVAAQYSLMEIENKKGLELSYEGTISDIESLSHRLQKDHTALKIQLHSLQDYSVEWKKIYVALQQEALVVTLNCKALQAAHTKDQLYISSMQQQMQQMQQQLLQHECVQSNLTQLRLDASVHKQQTQEFLQQIKQVSICCLQQLDHLKQQNNDLLIHISLLLEKQLMPQVNNDATEMLQEEEISISEQEITAEKQQLHHVQNLYRQLRTQFEEKQQVLAQTRAELFNSENQFLALKNDIALSDIEFDYEWRYFEKDLQQQQQDLQMAQEETEILQDIISVLVQ